MINDPFRPRPMCVRWHAISLLFSEAPHFLDAIFDESRQSFDVDYCSELLLANSCVDRHVKLLLKVALGIWRGDFDPSDFEAYATLPPRHLECLGFAIDFLRNPNHPKSCLYDYTCFSKNPFS